jgi:hypothetical protein
MIAEEGYDLLKIQAVYGAKVRQFGTEIPDWCDF